MKLTSKELENVFSDLQTINKAINILSEIKIADIDIVFHFLLSEYNKLNEKYKRYLQFMQLQLKLLQHKVKYQEETLLISDLFDFITETLGRITKDEWLEISNEIKEMSLCLLELDEEECKLIDQLILNEGDNKIQDEWECNFSKEWSAICKGLIDKNPVIKKEFPRKVNRAKSSIPLDIFTGSNNDPPVYISLSQVSNSYKIDKILLAETNSNIPNKQNDITLNEKYDLYELIGEIISLLNENEDLNIILLLYNEMSNKIIQYIGYNIYVKDVPINEYLDTLENSLISLQYQTITKENIEKIIYSLSVLKEELTYYI